MVKKAKLLLGSPCHWPVISCRPQKLQDLPVVPHVLDLSKASLDHWNLPVNYLLSSESRCLSAVHCSVLGLGFINFGLPILKETYKPRRGRSALLTCLFYLYAITISSVKNLSFKILCTCFLVYKDFPNCFSNGFSQLDYISSSFDPL